MTLRFDDALPALVEALADLEMLPSLANGRLLVLRDVTGVLTLIIRDPELERKREIVSEQLAALKPYVDTRPVATPQELLDDRLAVDDAGIIERVPFNDNYIPVRVVDRRLVGADWLRAPMEPILNSPPIAVFWSLKGGVGRSTALCVAAAAFARARRNILIVDLDLEAPGIGAMLVRDEDCSRFGALDYYVENGFDTIDDSFLNDMISPSILMNGLGGSLDVVPAVGKTSGIYPHNVLAKLARAYIDKPRLENDLSFLEQTRDLLARLTARRKYDAVLIDARAGLNESTAASVLGLGATVLLFGLNSPQTFDGYRYLFAHLSRFVDIEGGLWRERLQMVHAKADSTAEVLAGETIAQIPPGEERFVDRSFDLFAEFLYDEAEPGDVEAFNFNLTDPDAPHTPWFIFDDSNFKDFRPLTLPWQLQGRMAEATFGDFIKRLKDRLLLNIEAAGGSSDAE